jgi:hypothetical protein
VSHQQGNRVPPRTYRPRDVASDSTNSGPNSPTRTDGPPCKP